MASTAITAVAYRQELDLVLHFFADKLSSLLLKHRQNNPLYRHNKLVYLSVIHFYPSPIFADKARILPLVAATKLECFSVSVTSIRV
jgi:hypothetical protein